MLTLAQLIALEQSLHGQRVMSVYCANDVTDPAERTEWRRTLAHALSTLADRWHGAAGTDRVALQSAIGHVLAEVEALPIDRRFRGWVAFATSDGVVHAEYLPTRVPWVVAWDDRLRIAPYVRALRDRQRAIVAVVDSRTAALYVYQNDQLDALTTLHASHQLTPGTHMGDPPRLGFHAGTRGTTNTDRVRHARMVARTRLLTEVATRLRAEASSDDWLLVGGIPEHAKAVVSRVTGSEAERTRYVAGLDTHATPARLASAVARTVSALQADSDRDLVDAMVDGEERRDAVRMGSPASLTALQLGAVDRLVFSEQFVHAHPRIAEEAVRAAFACDSGVASVEGDAAARLDAHAAGIAAHLRYVPSEWSQPAL